jgi:hypothetical protein
LRPRSTAPNVSDAVARERRQKATLDARLQANRCHARKDIVPRRSKWITSDLRAACVESRARRPHHLVVATERLDGAPKSPTCRKTPAKHEHTRDEGGRADDSQTWQRTPRPPYARPSYDLFMRYPYSANGRPKDRHHNGPHLPTAQLSTCARSDSTAIGSRIAAEGNVLFQRSAMRPCAAEQLVLVDHLSLYTP